MSGESPRPKSVRDLDARELRAVIEEGVYRGVLKAVAVYALISLLIWALISIFGAANQYS
jgi:hypothetical protein